MFSFAHSFIGERFSYMEHLGYDMHLICSDDEKAKVFVAEQGIAYYPLKINRMPTPLDDIKAIIAIIRYVHKHKIDLIVGHADKGTLLAGIVGLLTHKKVVTFIHGTNYETCSGLKKWIFVFVDWFQTVHSDVNICVSDFLVELRTQMHIAPRNKQFVPNKGSCCGIDCINKFAINKITPSDKENLRRALSIPQDDFVIGFCGRLTRDKGIEELVDAFMLVQKDLGNKVKLLLVGDNDIRDAVSHKVAMEINNNPSIICTGKIYDNIELYYSIMNLFVLPTHRDGFGMCLIEAAAMGVPVLSSSKTGSRNAMSVGNNGEYIDININDIFNKVIYLYNNPQLLNEYSRFGTEWVQSNFFNKDVWNSIIEIYEKVLKAY